MKGGYIVFKCRRCLDIVKDVHCPDMDLTLRSILHGDRLPTYWIGRSMLPQPVTLHTCEDGGEGVCDLIGADPDKEVSVE